ncbi:methylaspartate/glutamate mutase E subunit [Amycolatopsis mediterranei S699]|uniref:Methylaspartate/glutamate mutase E subunit n=2 Tax=Amycolatopsis mediterranei TaxID=33910 RepID=A0A0H3D748_AMYMU|nr:methylaspartate mutase [Amycolatopsis mediterranei]ADJ46516.1 methylaspartate/glutamate mutase E subunit [Amycolatopsis mediterranei U32]AEK43316.1 methylaspartate/glutamate mutase E subunit [Amycolatopsis mediterranei S699]AFO78227.1 methylaspartate/glutamate mutase E subunit [Amycolatopsis mediterranei S699]AGT85355.1 methylaspartate/glutamate mutase E subunit [Amycolatopsis mediterranei RB]KDO06173.1 methylaspartate mutase [Amycolatopsis mediterranei]
MSTGRSTSPWFGGFVADMHDAGQLVVQPRMGVSDPGAMRAGLLATRDAAATTVGTITLDSYTRTGAHAAARAALASGGDLNGYPILAHEPATTRAMLDGVAGPGFPVQVRHGSAVPDDIVRTLIGVGLHATEGGPISYCLPYGRVPVQTSVRNWVRSCERLAALRADGVEPHLESFGGCLLGMLCPPSLLVAVSVLEGLFFRQNGLRSISLSYAQQSNADQDREAILALRRLAAELMPDLDWHIVLYTYMGMYPRSSAGGTRLLREAAGLAVRTGAARLVVKTLAEAHRIPTVAENVRALEVAAAAARQCAPVTSGSVADSGIYREARELVGAVTGLSDDLGRALADAFRLGYLDVPYCLHPDNAGRSRSYLDQDGRLRWSQTGSMPVRAETRPVRGTEQTAAGLLASLSFVQRRFDDAGPDPGAVSTAAR